MASADSFLQYGVSEFKRAAGLDEAKEYESAKAAYISSSEAMLSFLKYSKCDAARKQVRQKLEQILARVEKLDEYLAALKEAENKPAPTGSSGTATKDASKKAEGEEDKEKAQRRAALSDAIVTIKDPNVTWDSVCGLTGAKEALKEAVVLPLRFPQLFVGNRKPWKGILLYGPPGTGKTFLAKAVATEFDCAMIAVSASNLVSKWLGEAEKNLREVFDMARQMHKEDGKPVIIFVDEIDSMCGARSEGENDAVRRLKTEFLVQMQGVGNDTSGILLLGATNLPQSLDNAVRRRMERRIYIPLPDESGRYQMLKTMLGETPHNLEDDQFKEVAKRTPFYSGSDMSVLTRNAMMESIRTLQLATHFKRVVGPDPNDPDKTCDTRLVPCSPGDPMGVPMTLSEIADPKQVMTLPVTYMDFLKALKTARPSVSAEDVASYDEFTKNFGQED